MACLAPPRNGALYFQRRWDTSPYRRVHRLTYTRLNRPRWPANGSVVWRPSWGLERPMPPDILLPALSAPPASHQQSDFSPAPLQKAELLHHRLYANLTLSEADSLALIQRDRVTVNGHLQRTDRWVSGSDVVAVNGHRLEDLASLALLAHKPARCALTEGDPLRRPTYASLLPDPTLVARPAGPVDLNSSGLLIITNRRALASAVMRVPGLCVTLVAKLRAPLRPWQLAALRGTAAFDGVRPELVEVSAQEEDGTDGDNADVAEKPVLRVVLPAGRPAHLRRALAAVQSPPCLSICCVGLGPLSLEEPALLRPGTMRPLAEAEIASVLEEAGEATAARAAL